MWGEAVTEVWGVEGRPSAAEVASAEGRGAPQLRAELVEENQTPPPLESRAPRKGLRGRALGMGAQVHHAGGAEESSQGDRELLTPYIQTARSAERVFCCSCPGPWPQPAPN